MTTKKNLKKQKTMENNITIGGSMIAAILGVSEYMTPLEAWEVLTDKRKTDPNQYALVRGRVAEEFIEKLSCELWGYDIEYRQFGISYGIGHGTVDAILVNPDKTVTILEFKSSNIRVEEYEEIPLQYRLQVQWYMGLFVKNNIKIKNAHIIFMDGYFNLKRFEIPFDKEVFDAIYQAAEEWHQKYILGNTPPPEVDADILKRINDIEPNGAIELPSEIYPVLEELEKIKDQIKGLEYRKKEIEDKIKLLMSEYEEGYIGNIKILFKSHTRESVDTQTLKKKYPSIFKELKKETQFRVLRINFKIKNYEKEN